MLPLLLQDQHSTTLMRKQILSLGAWTIQLLLKHFLAGIIPTCKLMQHSHRRELGTRERKKIKEKGAKVKVGSRGMQLLHGLSFAAPWTRQHLQFPMGLSCPHSVLRGPCFYLIQLVVAWLNQPLLELLIQKWGYDCTLYREFLH